MYRTYWLNIFKNCVDGTAQPGNRKRSAVRALRNVRSVLLVKTIIIVSCCWYSPHQPLACTGIRLTTTNHQSVYARTLEFGDDLHSTLLFVPRTFHIQAVGPTGKHDGMAWDTRYAVVGIDAFDTVGFLDGVNEHGLAGGLFYFPGFAEYQEVPKDAYQRSVPMWLLLTWILTTCTTVAQVKERLPTIYVSKAPFAAFGGTPPAHLIVHDKHGACVVIEYIKGVLHLHENPVGVITNSPSFDWHMTNVRNYINLTPLNAVDKKIDGMSFAPLGQGSGMLGIPGDMTPPSRFIRALFLVSSALPVHTPLEAVYQAFHILNMFDIPQGFARDAHGNSDFTRWTSAIDLHNKIFYLRAYENFNVRKIELMRLALDSKITQRWPLVWPEQVIDITHHALLAK